MILFFNKFVLIIMERTSFYCTLPSNASTTYFPNNTPSDFRVKLPYTIVLDDDWECGLHTCLYPHTWPIVNENSGFYWRPKQAKNTKNARIEIDLRSYTFYTFLTKLNEKAATETKIKFGFDKDHNRVEIINVDENVISLDKSLSQALGFGNKVTIITGRHQVATHPISLHPTITSIYVYSDIIEASIVGGQLANLLQILPISGQFGDTLLKTFDSIAYFPISKHSFDTLLIELRDSSGEVIDFNYGEVVLTLHFRRKSVFG